ncbi:MAG: hypothetical protein R2852_02085 [Bacteroidia bacterium]
MPEFHLDNPKVEELLFNYKHFYTLATVTLLTVGSGIEKEIRIFEI